MSDQRFVVEVNVGRFVALGGVPAKRGAYHTVGHVGLAYQCSRATAEAIVRNIMADSRAACRIRPVELRAP